MKHAYLIIAHNEFEVLARLINAIDDVRNDIYIHYDSKLVKLPSIEVKHSNLIVLEARIDVRWGDLSVIEAEYALLDEATRTGSYSYLHLLSGVDMPLKSQHYIHTFFSNHAGKEFIGFSQGNLEQELTRKVKRYHVFPKSFRPNATLWGYFVRITRSFLLLVQEWCMVERNRTKTVKKGPQWVSITQNFAFYLLQCRDQVVKDYSNTFCSDEFFVQTICWNSSFKQHIFNALDEWQGSQRMIGWKDGQLIEWQDKDFEKLMQSDLIFARKFSSKNLQVVDRLLAQIKN